MEGFLEDPSNRDFLPYLSQLPNGLLKSFSFRKALFNSAHRRSTMLIQDVKQLTEDSNIWDLGGPNHRFQLTTTPYLMEEQRVEELKQLGWALRQVLLGCSRIVAIAFSPELSRGDTWKNIRRMFKAGVPRNRRVLQDFRPGDLATLFRVDLVETIDGDYQFIEIEGDKTHGMGYAALSHHLLQTLENDAQTFEGVTQYVAREVRRRRPKSPRLVIIEPWSDRFYRPATTFFCHQLEQCGVSTLRVQEEDPCKIPTGSLLLSLPPINSTKDRKSDPSFERRIISRYLKKELELMIPSKGFLASKALMGLISNPEQHPEVEAILRSQMSDRALMTVRSYLPRTHLIDRDTKLETGVEWVLKISNSSGAHGVYFSGDPRFDAALRHAKYSRAFAVAQEVVKTRTRAFDVYDMEGTPIGVEERHMRIAPFFTWNDIADIAVTACRNPPVHGGTESIMTSTVIVSH